MIAIAAPEWTEMPASGDVNGGPWQSFRISEVRPNPNRDVARYPIPEFDIQKLVASYEATDYWLNIVGRINDQGEAEIAYGHARLEALRRVRGEEGEITIIIRDLSDEEMLRIMIDENMQREERGATNEQEGVEGVIRAYHAGVVHLETPPDKSPHAELRFAPSFQRGGHADVPDARREHAYTASTVAGFLGWRRDKVEKTLQALELIEAGFARPEFYTGLGTAQAHALTKEIRRIIQRRQEQTEELERNAAAEATRATEADDPTERQEAEALRGEFVRQANERRRSAAEDAAYYGLKIAIRLRRGEWTTREVVERTAQLYKPPSLKMVPEEEPESEPEEAAVKGPRNRRPTKAARAFFAEAAIWDERLKAANPPDFKGYEDALLRWLDSHAKGLASLKAAALKAKKAKLAEVSR